MNSDIKNSDMLQWQCDNRRQKKSLEVLSLAISLRDNDRRIDDLLLDFEEDCEKGWAMAIGTYFLDALDIKKTDKVIDGKKSLVWTQGGNFSFTEGDIIYDTLQAYKRWETALQTINIAYQILASVPSRPRKEIIFFRKNSSFNGSLKDSPKATLRRRELIFKTIPTTWVELEKIKSDVLEDTNKNTSTKVLDKLFLLGALEKKVELVKARFPGYIRYQVMVPNIDKSQLYVQKEATMSQDDFITLLITGREQPT